MELNQKSIIGKYLANFKILGNQITHLNNPWVKDEIKGKLECILKSQDTINKMKSKPQNHRKCS